MLTGKRIQIQPKDAWVSGTNLRKALKLAPEQTRAYVIAEVASLCRDMDMKKTVNTDEEMEFICRTILDDFPALKVEEIRIAFNAIRKGEQQLYERLKGPEILMALKNYEGNVRAPILEELNRMHKDAPKMKALPEWTKMMKSWIPPDDHTPTSVTGHGIGSRLRKHLDVKKESES